MEDSRLASECVGTGLCVDRQFAVDATPALFRGDLLHAKRVSPICHSYFTTTVNVFCRQ